MSFQLSTYEPPSGGLFHLLEGEPLPSKQADEVVGCHRAVGVRAFFLFVVFKEPVNVAFGVGHFA